MTQVDKTLDARFLDETPRRMIGDMACDSGPLDEQPAEEKGIETIAPHRPNRTKTITQDGRPLRRYRRRWKVERPFAWLFNFRRLVVRHENHAENFLEFSHLGCAIIPLRHL